MVAVSRRRRSRAPRPRGTGRAPARIPPLRLRRGSFRCQEGNLINAYVAHFRVLRNQSKIEMRHRARPRKVGLHPDSSGHEKRGRDWRLHASSIMENVRLTRCGHFFYGYDARIHNGMRDRGWAVRRPLPIAERLRARPRPTRTASGSTGEIGAPGRYGADGSGFNSLRDSAAGKPARPCTTTRSSSRRRSRRDGRQETHAPVRRLRPARPERAPLKRCGTMAWYAGLPYHACAASWMETRRSPPLPGRRPRAFPAGHTRPAPSTGGRRSSRRPCPVEIEFLLILRAFMREDDIGRQDCTPDAFENDGTIGESSAGQRHSSLTIGRAFSYPLLPTLYSSRINNGRTRSVGRMSQPKENTLDEGCAKPDRGAAADKSAGESPPGTGAVETKRRAHPTRASPSRSASPSSDPVRASTGERLPVACAHLHERFRRRRRDDRTAAHTAFRRDR